MFRLSPITVLVTASAIVLSVALGVRQTFGFYLSPIASEHLVTIAALSFALALQNLMWGLGQPFAGALTDRFGPGPVVGAGAVLYSIGMLAVAWYPGTLAVLVGFGIFVGLGQAAMTFAVVLSSLSRAVDASQRATAVALAAAGGSLGQVALVPLAQIAIDHAGFRSALIVMAVIALAVAPLGFLLRASSGASVVAPASQATGSAVRTALRDPNFLFLTTGFFACGYQLAFMGIHLPGYLLSCHIGLGVGAAALATVGFFNVIGSFAFGKAVDRWQPQFLLTFLYGVRASSTVLYLVTPISPLTTLLFAVIMGLTWLGTVPLTNAVIARLHGLPNLGALFGVCFVGHQLGGFLGALSGGLSLQMLGSYTPVWIATIAIGYGAAVLNLPIRFRPMIAVAGA